MRGPRSLQLNLTPQVWLLGDGWEQACHLLVAGNGGSGMLTPRSRTDPLHQETEVWAAPQELVMPTIPERVTTSHGTHQMLGCDEGTGLHCVSLRGGGRVTPWTRDLLLPPRWSTGRGSSASWGHSHLLYSCVRGLGHFVWFLVPEEVPAPWRCGPRRK